MKASRRNGHSHTLAEKLMLFTMTMTMTMTMINLNNSCFNLDLPPALVEGSRSERASLLISVHCLLVCIVVIGMMRRRDTMEAA